MLLVHLGIALASILATGYCVLSPTRARLRTSYWLVLFTIGSGTYLVIKTHSPLLSACITGLVFIGASLSAITLAQRRLAKNSVKDED